MKAMILAAGLGTRLKPLTDTKPKALVDVAGEPMLERVIRTLKNQGVDNIVINVHHFAGQVKDFISSKDFGINISLSDESDELLDTGGGIVKALPLLFVEDKGPALIHNVDIISNADLRSLINGSHTGSTLLVSERDSSRKLVFDDKMELKGWHDIKNCKYRPKVFKIEEGDRELAFSGIYTITYDAALEMKRVMGDGKFSIIDYLLSDKRKEPAIGFKMSDLRLIDIGKPATLSQASAILSGSDAGKFFN